MREVELGTPFCRRHGDAVFGAMLGALVYTELARQPGSDRPGIAGYEKIRKRAKKDLTLRPITDIMFTNEWADPSDPYKVAV